MASNKRVTNEVTAGRFRLTHLAVAGGAVMLLAGCGTRGLTTAEPAARVVSICPTPGKARMACDQDDQREIAAARRLIERQRGTAATTAATTTPTTAATTTSTAAPATTVAETTTVATEATAAPAPEAAAPPAEAAPVEEAPAPEEAAPAEEPAPEEEEPATTVAKRKPKTPRTTAAPVEEAPAPAPAPEQPPTTEAPAPPPAAVQVDTSVAGRVIALTNAQRAAAGLSPVSANGALTAAAAAHSKDQAAHNTMTHTGSNGSTLGQRITAAGFGWRTIGENVAMGYGSADSVMNGWMNSPGHRANILKADFTSIGVAVAYAADGTPYWTMDLGA